MEPTGVWFADRDVPTGGTFVRGQLPNIQDGKPPSCIFASGAVLFMFAVVLLAGLL